MPFQKATKYQAKLRMAISGPAGAGKTYTALTLAVALADGGSVALIDTEHRSASKYADLFDFDTTDLPTFHPQSYIDAIHEAEAAGYVVLVIDSLTHAWSGQGGLLQEKDRIAKQKYNNNTFSAWNDAGAIQTKLVEAILGSKLHIIATVRSKMDYVVEDVNGKKTPRKLGMAPMQRDDLPYEFDVFSTMEVDNTLIVEKTRCPALNGAVVAKPDAHVADILKAWLADGAPAPARIDADPPEGARARALVGRVFKFKDEDFEARWTAYKQHVLGRAVADPDLSPGDLIALRAYAEGEARKHEQPAAKSAA